MRVHSSFRLWTVLDVKSRISFTWSCMKWLIISSQRSLLFLYTKRHITFPHYEIISISCKKYRYQLYLPILSNAYAH